MVIFRLYFRVIVKQNNDPEIESKYHYYNLSCFIQITCILSSQDVIIIRSMFLNNFLKLAAGKGYRIDPFALFNTS